MPPALAPPRRPTPAVSRVESRETWASAVTVCVPVGPDETAWGELLNDLTPLLNAGGSVMLCGADDPPPALPAGVRWRPAPRANRAAQLNAAAAAARTRFLWFLHSDSRLAPGDVRAAVAAAAGNPHALHHCRLRFADDGPALTRLNGWGANLRSRAFGMPFGDQGFLLAADLLADLGGFDESAPYGEGHLLAWAARRAGVRLNELPAAVVTSARKYRRRGWGRTTALHAVLTLRQAAPQWWAWVRGR